MEYANEDYLLVMVPAFLSVIYNLGDTSSIFKPFIGAGLSLHGDYNKHSYFSEFENNRYGFTYGYHTMFGIDIPINQKLIFTGNFKYNILVPRSLLDMNQCGIIWTAGFTIPLEFKK
jgi:outer membrane protein W